MMAHYPSKSKQHGFIFKIRIHRYSRKGKKNQFPEGNVIARRWKSCITLESKDIRKVCRSLLRLNLFKRLALGVCSHPTASRSKVMLTKSTPSNYRLAYQAGSGSAHSTPPSPWLQPNGHRGRWDGGGRRWRRLVELAEARGGVNEKVSVPSSQVGLSLISHWREFKECV